MDKLKRFSEIDDMRGLAMLVMILIHTNAYFLSDKFAAMLWNISQFAVPVFLFCSAYVYYQRKHEDALKNFPSYIWKRFTRLLIPYYLFAVVFVIVVLWKEPAKITGSYLSQSLLVIGGVDINWLVLLFLFLTFLMPVLAYLWEKKKFLFYLYAFFAILSSLIFVFYRWPFNYKLIMWLPWSVMLIYTMYFAIYHKRRIFYFLTVAITSILFIVFLFIEMHIQHSLSFYDNKYPPNVFLLSYGIGSIAILHFLAKFGAFSIKPVQTFLHFLSFNSYSLFFIHYIYLYILSFAMWKWHFNWIIFFLAVLICSLITQKLLDFVRKALKRSR